LRMSCWSFLTKKLGYSKGKRTNSTLLNDDITTTIIFLYFKILSTNSHRLKMQLVTNILMFCVHIITCIITPQSSIFSSIIFPGRSLPLIFCIHVRSGPIYWWGYLPCKNYYKVMVFYM
jgi:hypothetical protein